MKTNGGNINSKQVERKLEKYDSGKSKKQQLSKLDDEVQDPNFDQFQGKPSTFNFEKYSSKLDLQKLTPDLIAKASQLEINLASS